jgi:hypothetical protein
MKRFIIAFATMIAATPVALVGGSFDMKVTSVQIRIEKVSEKDLRL